MSNIPMSTTWVFIGLLGGRELAMRFANRKRAAKEGEMTLKTTILMILRDFSFALIGLLVSVIMAIAINESLQQEITAWFSEVF